jgi:hypothetical protein
MPENIFNFLQWMRKKTTHVQDNVVFYKGKHYFLDRKTESGRPTDGGADDLWAVYVKETIG